MYSFHITPNNTNEPGGHDHQHIVDKFPGDYEAGKKHNF